MNLPSSCHFSRPTLHRGSEADPTLGRDYPAGGRLSLSCRGAIHGRDMAATNREADKASPGSEDFRISDVAALQL